MKAILWAIFVYTMMVGVVIFAIIAGFITYEIPEQVNRLRSKLRSRKVT